MRNSRRSLTLRLVPVFLALPSARVEAAPLRLDEAVKLAMTRNERARIADLNVVASEAGVQRARAAFLPTVTVSGNDVLRPPAPMRSAQSNNSATGTIALNQPLVNVAAWPLYSQAKQLLEGQRAQTLDDRRLLAFDAVHAFLAVLTADAVRQAAQRRFDSAASNLADTQARVQAQLSSSNDATRAQIDLADASRELESDRGSLTNTLVQLSFVVNNPVTEPVAKPDTTLRVAEQPLPGLDVLARLAVSHRPDLVAKQHAAMAAHDFADEPLLRLVPTLGLSGQAQALSNPAANGRWNDESVSATLTWILYDAGVRYADKRLRDANASIADLNLRALVRLVGTDVHSAVVSLQTQQAAFRLSEQAMQASQQSADETAVLYRQGLAKAIELVDANDSRFLAEVTHAEAEYALAQSYVNLRQALGLDPEGTELR